MSPDPGSVQCGHFQELLDFWCEVCLLFCMAQHDLSDLDERLKRVSDLGGPLEVMNDIIDFEV